VSSLATIDVAILGGGPAGMAAAATLLRHTDMSVTVLERSSYDGERPGETISPGIVPLLEYLGLREVLEQRDHLPSYGTAAAWGETELVPRDFLFSGEEHGWHVDRAYFDKGLAEAVSGLGGTVLTETCVCCDKAASGNWRLVISTKGKVKREVIARFVIDATGARATFGRARGSRRRIDDYLSAVVLYFKNTNRTSVINGVRIEAIKEGWWYSAAIPNGGAVLVFMTDASVVRDLELHKLHNLMRMVSRTVHMTRRLEGYTCITMPRIVPVYSGLLVPLGGANWIAAGDAAVSFDPISSLGIGHALYSGIYAARVAHEELSGREALRKQYVEGIRRTYEQYWMLRGACYALENRWKEHSFWCRRQNALLKSYSGALTGVP
jgi:flavin-dependent dehydrogenase